MKDALEYYKTLGVSADADAETIKRAYRDLAKVWHPDYNKDASATDMFQKISIAYDVLSDEQSRLRYDLLSLVYGKENYPDIESMTIFQDDGDGVRIRVLNLFSVRSWFSGYKISQHHAISKESSAFSKTAKNAALNWLCGWWHPKAFLQNIKAIKNNFKHPLNESESKKALIHNMIVYARDKQQASSVKCGLQAGLMFSGEDKALIDKFISLQNIKVSAPKAWKITSLKAGQLIVPAMAAVAIIFSGADKYMNLSESELWNIFASKKEINYYQEVNFGQGESVDDVVVGKIMSVPVNKSDNTQLYHLTQDSKIMYGPSSDFDVIKTLPAQTTVRLTGYTPDNVWARIMIDNGEIGFVYFADIKQGIGKDIPFGSAITE